MKVSNDLWKERLSDSISDQLAAEIDQFESEIQLRQQGGIDEVVFAETRLRRGAYGQRYDNGLRHDGAQQQTLPFDETKNTKGANTVWDAPGMQRIKIPFGGMNPGQLETMAELAEEYSDGIGHITTRQDFQLHYIHIDDTPAVMRRLAAVGITTREACGNSVRNVCGCPFAGVCQDEAFDITPYARAQAFFLLGHADAQNFGRKFKPSFSGCAQHACGLAAMHDMGFIAQTREVDGKEERGFRLVVGGGLGAVPQQAKLYDEFLPIEEMLPISQAIARVFAKHGEKNKRSRARMKFLIQKWGIEKFIEEVKQERANLEPDPGWTEFMDAALEEQEQPSRPAGELPAPNGDAQYNHWLKTNLRPQRQDGYYAVTVALPLGDITSDQMRKLADVVREFTSGTVRTSVEQNFVIRWVSGTDVPALYAALEAARLHQPGASNILDIVACPGTDTCKLGISSSRGLAAELHKRLKEKSFELDQAIQDLHIKISGCFNSCGQHHASDIGFYGVSRTINGYKVPHFNVVLGGQWEENAGSYGLPIVAVASKRIPDVLDRITEFYMNNREPNERFPKFVTRIGKGPIRDLLEEFTGDMPEYDEQPDLFSDWGDPRLYSLGDIGKGECAGEVVTAYQFAMAAADRLHFEAQVVFDTGDAQKAGEGAWQAMLCGAKALVQFQYDDVTDDPEEIVDEFKDRFHDSGIFHDPFAGDKFAQYLFAAYEEADRQFNEDTARALLDEANLFLEAVHACYNKLRAEVAASA